MITPTTSHEVTHRFPVDAEGNTVSVRIVVETHLQEPSEGDGVKAEASLYLPAVHGHLHPELKFGLRVRVMHECLQDDWGAYESDTERYRSGQRWVAATHASARRLALKEAEAELEKLVAAISDRLEAHAHVDDPDLEPEPAPTPASVPEAQGA